MWKMMDTIRTLPAIQWRPVVVEPLGNHFAIMGVEDPLLADRVANAQRRPAEYLAAERMWMDHRADVRVGKKIHNIVLAGFDIDFDLGEARHIGMGHAVAGVVVPGGSHEALTGQRCYRRLSETVDVGGRDVAIINAAQLNRALSGLRECHAGSAPLSKNTLIGDLVILGPAAETLRCDLLEFLPGIHRRRMRRARHRVRCLAAAGDTRKRNVLRRVTPNHIALFPGDTENFRTRAVHVNHGLRSKIADSGLEADPAIGRDDQKSVEPDGAAYVTTEGYADAAHLRADPLRTARHPLLPLELLRAAIECILYESAGRVLQLALHRRSILRLALGTVDAADGHLVQTEFARSFGDDRFDDGNSLQSEERRVGKECRSRWSPYH